MEDTTGTPLDYSSTMYRVYFEVVTYKDMAKNAIINFLGKEATQTMVELPYGYELEIPIQVIPEVVRVLEEKNIGVYQVVRYSKIKKMWPSH